MSLRGIIQRLTEARAPLREVGEVPQSPQTLYVARPLLNADEFMKWARGQGFSQVAEADSLHVTVLYSKTPVMWNVFKPDSMTLRVIGGARSVVPLGDEGAVVLKFASDALLRRHQEFRAGGGSHDYESYQAHVTVTYQAGDLDLSGVETYQGPLIFGPEVFEPIDVDWKPGES